MTLSKPTLPLLAAICMVSHRSHRGHTVLLRKNVMVSTWQAHQMEWVFDGVDGGQRLWAPVHDATRWRGTIPFAWYVTTEPW